MFDATYSGSGDDAKVAYTIKTNNPFYSNTTTKGILDEYFDFGDISSDNTTKTVSVKTNKQDADTKSLSEADARKLADALQSYITDANTDPNATVAENSQTATITVSGPGYYIVTGSASANDTKERNTDVVSGVMLTTAAPTATVNPKADVPTLDKKITGVKEGTTTVTDAVLDVAGVAGKAAAAKVGSTVSFELDSKVPDTTGYSTYTYTITDTLSEGLDFVANTDDTSNVVVKINNAAKVANTDYDIAINGRVLTITIHSDVIKAAEKGQDIVVTYDATVNDKALNHDFENNTAHLQYSNNPKNSESKNTTPDKKTYVVNLNLDVNKVDSSNEATKLPGAKFKLYRIVGTGNAKQYYKWNEQKVTWVDDTTGNGADTFVTNDEGKFTQVVRGLDKGTYYLEETEAPSGYNKLANPVKVEIFVTENANDNTVKYTYKVDDEADAHDVQTNGTITLGATQTDKHASAAITVKNGAGSVLPSTGGIGTYVFYAAGGILIIVAAALLITKKKRNA